MQKNYFILTLIVVLLIGVLGLYVLANFNFSEYRYTIAREGVVFVSNTADPGTLLQEMKEGKNFVVSPEFVKVGSENSYMTGSLTLLNTLLAAKKRDFVVVARIVDEKGQLIECQSNLGDIKQSKVIPIEECNQLINDTTVARIFVGLPDNALPQPRVVVERQTVYIQPSSFSNVAYSTYVFLKVMYPDADSIIANVNEIVGRL